MDKSRIKDLKIRKKFSLLEKKKNIFKSFLHNIFVSKVVKLKIAKLCFLTFKKFSFSKVKNRCLFSGRSRSVISKYRISRICFKNLASNCQIAGILKNIW